MHFLPVLHCTAHSEWTRAAGRPFEDSVFRQWLTRMLSSADSRRFIDCFRELHADREGSYTHWNIVTSARSTNFGTRIDYALISDALLPSLTACDHLDEVNGMAIQLYDFDLSQLTVCS